MEGIKFNETSATAAVNITTQDIVFATFYSLIVLLGVVGNAIVITIFRKTPSLHTTTNYLLMNLAVADLLTLSFCPGTYDFVFNQIKLRKSIGDIVCKFFVGNVIVSTSFTASTLTLCTIAVERYVAIVKPFERSFIVTPKKAFLAIVTIWMMSTIFTFPEILWTEFNTAPVVSSSRYPCSRPWTLIHVERNAYIIFHCIVLIFLPSLLISFCYFSIIFTLKWSLTDPSLDEQERKIMEKLLRLLLSLAVTFCITCLPFAGFFCYIAVADNKRVVERFESLFLWHRLVKILLFSNPFIDPLLYAAQSTNYRQGLCRLCCKNSRGREREIGEAIDLATRRINRI